MHGLGHLLVGLLPVVLLASISPVVTLNASTAVSTEGQRGGWRFVAGQAAVLLVIGSACVGMLGAAASDVAEREIASHTVDRMLGLALLLYGVWLAWKWWSARNTVHDGAGRPTSRGMFGWGALGMATNFTSLPLYAAACQRIGASGLWWAVRVPLAAVVTACVLTPSWSPVLLARLRPGGGDVSPRTRARVARWTSLASTLACLLGGVVLVWTAR